MRPNFLDLSVATFKSEATPADGACELAAAPQETVDGLASATTR